MSNLLNFNNKMKHVKINLKNEKKKSTPVPSILKDLIRGLNTKKDSKKGDWVTHESVDIPKAYSALLYEHTEVE